MGTVIIAKIGDFIRFNPADKMLAYAGISPSTYQSGQLDNCYSHMENEVPNPSAMLFTMQLNMSVTRMCPSVLISKRNILKENIITLRYLMPLRS